MNGVKTLFILVLACVVCLLISQLQAVSTDKCDPLTEFQCHTANKCIKKHQVCDGFNDCADFGDEINCQWCNRTFKQQDDTVTTKIGRFVIMSAQNLNKSQPINCFYKIINKNPDTITSIRLRKFSVGQFNIRTKECDEAWIEIKESDHDENLVVSKSFIEPPGRFCGTLQNFRNTYYSSKQYITINYFVSNIASASSFEFEVSFYKKQDVSVDGKSIKPGGQVDYGARSPGCDRSFNDCDEKICAISSPGYPGIYLKNLGCRFTIHNRLLKKIILINDNLQLDAKICHFNHTNPHLSRSFLCDSGVRSSISCLDTLNVIFNSTKNFIKDVCGLGRMKKIVTDTSFLSLELETTKQGYFANTGFLFYALGQQEYFENFEKYNDLSSVALVDKEAVKQLERLQINVCNSDMKVCTIRIDETSVKRVAEQRFKIGYLFGLNQYHPTNFKLNYEIKTNSFNTIAIYLIRYDPHDFVASSKCQVNYLTIEAPVTNSNKNQMSQLFKICQPDELTNKTTRLFLVKAAKAGGASPDLTVQYFALRESIGTNEMSNFILSYEFLNFDWDNYVTGSVCDFEYISNSGRVTNPKASIFYRYHPNSGESDKLKCRYRLIAGPNQYIRLTIRRINFNLGDCQNVYFSQAHNLKYERCESLQRKLKISDSFYSKDTETMNLRMCVCSLNSINNVYISKSNIIDIEYDIGLTSLGSRLENVDFEIDYEFVERNCEDLVLSKQSDSLKGAIAYKPDTKTGIQTELINVFDEVSIKTSSEYKQYVDMLRSNRNFHCRFRLEAPRNHFVYVEFVDFKIAKNCEQNSIKLYSKFSAVKEFNKSDKPFIKFCNLDNVDLVDLPNRIGHDSGMITAFFGTETTVSPTLSCYKSNNKICFMTSEFENELNPFSVGPSEVGFFNEVVIEIEANSLDELFYQIRYHYFMIDFERVDNLESDLSVASRKLGVKTRSDERFGQDATIQCDFKCPKAVSNSNRSVDICVSDIMVCDGEIDCIFNDADELNCKL